MATKRGTIAAIAAGAAVAGSVVAVTLQKTRQLQDEARAKGAHVPKGPYEAVVKRPLGAAFSGVALVALAPVLGATAIAVRAKLGSPVIFKQRRPGLNAEPFDIYKFRTMTDERDPQTGELLPDEVRLTDFGKWLRSTSLDELPELYNVLKGDMSLIGPRPLLKAYLPLYTEEQSHRHDVMPGVTGLAQVNGRNAIRWEDKFVNDVEYVKSITFAGDAKIFLKTFKVLATREGISSRNSATMEAFTGKGPSEGSQKKALILANNDGGLYLFRAEILEALLKEADVVASIPYGPYFEKIERLGVRCVQCDELKRRSMNPASDIALLHHYERLIKDEKPDIVFTYTVKPNVYGGMVCSKLGVPYVANITGLGTAIERGGLSSRLVLQLYRIGLSHAQHIFFQNEANRSFMLSSKMITGTNSILHGSGVNVAARQPLPYPKEASVTFLFVARVMEDKGIEQFIEAAETVRRSHQDVEFHVCGPREKDYHGRLDEAVKADAITYHGEIEDMMSMYAMADCVVLPSFHEGMSNVLLEACAHARPIITTDVPGCREAVVDGKNGFLVQVRDSQSLIDAINRFLSLSNDERAAMGVAGREKAEREFNREIVIAAYMEELRKVSQIT